MQNFQIHSGLHWEVCQRNIRRRLPDDNVLYKQSCGNVCKDKCTVKYLSWHGIQIITKVLQFHTQSCISLHRGLDSSLNGIWERKFCSTREDLSCSCKPNIALSLLLFCWLKGTALSNLGIFRKLRTAITTVTTAVHSHLIAGLLLGRTLCSSRDDRWTFLRSISADLPHHRCIQKSLLHLKLVQQHAELAMPWWKSVRSSAANIVEDLFMEDYQIKLTKQVCAVAWSSLNKMIPVSAIPVFAGTSSRPACGGVFLFWIKNLVQ